MSISVPRIQIPTDLPRLPDSRLRISIHAPRTNALRGSLVHSEAMSATDGEAEPEPSAEPADDGSTGGVGTVGGHEAKETSTPASTEGALSLGLELKSFFDDESAYSEARGMRASQHSSYADMRSDTSDYLGSSGTSIGRITLISPAMLPINQLEPAAAKENVTAGETVLDLLKEVGIKGPSLLRAVDLGSYPPGLGPPPTGAANDWMRNSVEPDVRTKGSTTVITRYPKDNFSITFTKDL